jgi:hypothetical protein
LNISFRIKGFAPGKYKVLRSPVTWLVLVSLAIRLAIWLTLPSESGAFSAGGPYLVALDQHFWEFVFFAHTKPPLTYFFHAALFKLCDQACFSANLIFLMDFLMDSIAVGLVYATSVKLGLPRVITWLVALVYSIELINFELWLSGGHPDHLTIFFVALFAWAVVRSLDTPNPVTIGSLPSPAGC